MSIARREINRRELLLAAAGSMLVALVMSWPLPLNLGETIPRDLGDPLPQAWKVAWAGHALTTQPLDFFQSNQFWPERDSFAFGDMLIGYAPFALFVDGPRDAVVRYDLAAIRDAVRRDDLAHRRATMWRYRELLPYADESDIVSLGENMTPLLDCPRLARRLGLHRLWIKDESMLPTGSFKARGMAMAVTMGPAQEGTPARMSRCAIQQRGPACSSAATTWSARARSSAA